MNNQFNHIGQAYGNDANDFIRLYLTMVIGLLEELIANLTEYMDGLENTSEEAQEVYNFAHMMNIDAMICNSVI
jgi:hypothetical protein